jgi:hypothetical protein
MPGPVFYHVCPGQNVFLMRCATVIAAPELGLKWSLAASEWCAMVPPALRDEVSATG